MHMVNSNNPQTEMNASSKAGFLIGQAILLFTLPFVIFTFLSVLPSWVEAQADEVLIISLGAYIPFVILCEIAAWTAFRHKQTKAMIVDTLAPIIVLIILALAGYLF
jgi:threonine/homoserine/homoserine lactone efflux protein